MARDAIAGHCPDYLSDRLVDDLKLIASELVTNALEHGAEGIVTMDVVVSEAAAMLTVTSALGRSDIASPTTWSLPLPHQECGRGLAFATMLAHDVEVHRWGSVSGEPAFVAIVATVHTS